MVRDKIIGAICNENQARLNVSTRRSSSAINKYVNATYINTQQKQLSASLQKKRRRMRKLLYPHPKLSLGLVPYRTFTLK